MQTTLEPSAMLTDFYQLTIARAYFDQGRQDETAVFDLFYRSQPFDGSFAVFAGLNDVISFLESYKFTESDLEYIQQNMPGAPPEFIDYLRKIDTKRLKIAAPAEGSIVFPREPLLRIEGPIAICQLIETPILNCINFPTLMATNAARFKLLSGKKILMEFGLRRAQGANGGMVASKYSYLGGFDSTSNVRAGQTWNIPISGTVAHSFVCSFFDISQLKTTCIPHKETKEPVDLYQQALYCIDQMGYHTNPAELVAFIAQAQTYPENFLALADTYDTLNSGVPNFIAVSYGLHQAGYKGKGVRLDSGDLALLSKETRKLYVQFADRFDIDYARNFAISASNDINEEELVYLNNVGNELTAFGIGTHLVTCQKQPALGAVYKLVEIDGVPRVKVSNNLEKITIPSKKNLYRLFDAEGKEIADILTLKDETLEPGLIEGCNVYPNSEINSVECASIKPLFSNVWDNGVSNVDDLNTARQRCLDEILNSFNREVIKIHDPKHYPVMISKKLHQLMLKLINENEG